VRRVDPVQLQTRPRFLARPLQAFQQPGLEPPLQGLVLGAAAKGLVLGHGGSPHFILVHFRSDFALSRTVVMNARPVTPSSTVGWSAFGKGAPATCARIVLKPSR